MNRLTKVASASGIALGLVLGTGITAANADEAPDSAEAVSTNVTRNLECTGWFTGAAGVWNISTSQSNYVSGGSGACTVRFIMSLAFKGSFFSANKQQQLIYKGTRLTSATLKNV